MELSLSGLESQSHGLVGLAKVGLSASPLTGTEHGQGAPDKQKHCLSGRSTHLEGSEDILHKLYVDIVTGQFFFLQSTYWQSVS